MKSGDIETEPGPMKIQVLKVMSILLLTLVLLIIIGISNYNKAAKNSPNIKSNLLSSTSQLKISLNSISNLLILINNKKKKYIDIRTRAAYLVILLMLAGDIHPGPGPISSKEYIANDIDTHLGVCSHCRLEDKGEIILTCETCNNWCHLMCTSQSNEDINHLLQKSFQWICPLHTCKVNHYIPTVSQQHESPNRYEVLLQAPTDDIRRGKLANTKGKNKNQKRNKTQNEQKRIPALKKQKKEVNLFKCMPRISSKDYIGKEICDICLSTIAINSKAVMCRHCNRSTHIKCSDISMKEFKKIKKKRSQWNCSSCRKSEDTTDQIFNRNHCTEDQLPDEWDYIKKNKEKDEEIILHFNARSIVDKQDELFEIARNLKPAAIFITESWMDDSCPKGTAVSENYTIIRKDRSSNYKQKYGKTNGGGVAVLIRKGVRISTYTRLLDDSNEILWCTLMVNTTKHLIGLVYRASYTDLFKSDSDGNTDFESILQKTLDNNVLLIGDFNCDVGNPESTQDTKKLMCLAEEYRLKQLIGKPTRFNENTATIIDHIWVREESSLVRKAGTCEGISDHCGIYAYIREKICQEEEEIRCRNFKSFDIDKYREDIEINVKESKFEEAMNRKDVNAAFNAWIEALKKSANKHAPWKTFKPKQGQTQIPWFNTGIKEVTRTKNMYLKLYRMFKKPEDLKLYKIAKNKQTHLKRKCKKEYYTAKINDYIGESRKMWNILKDVTKHNYKENITPDVVNKETANRFNTFFATVGIQVQKQLNTLITPPILNKKGIFKFKPESSEKIKYLIDRIKPNVATGNDELSAKLIKAATPIILEDLKNMINLSYETQTFPDQLKIATVRALHKKGGNNDPEQYRPVSILTAISKIFERSAVEQIVSYYDSQNLLNPRQHAYRKYHSTTTLLFELIETARKHIDDGHFVALASMDLSKAFDSLSHNLILQKLDDMGLNETATRWIESYLTNRKQTVKFGKIESEQETVASGVPQGSILGPLLFITCTNNIVKELEEYDIFTYADDMQILIKGKSVKELGRKLEIAIGKANAYYNKNSLLCNPTKTEVMLLGTKIRLCNAEKLVVKVSNSHETKYLNGEKCLKILGVHIDQSLDWCKQTSAVKQRATNCIRNLHRVNQLIPMKQQRILYTSLVTPHFTYADTIWNNCGTTNENKIQQAQNFAAKSMLGVSKFSSSTEALKKLELLPLAEKRKINVAVQAKKALSGKAPANIQQLYMQQLSYESSRAAIRGDLVYPRHRLQQYQHGPLYTSIKVWNSIPLHVRDTNLDTFKSCLQKHLTKQYLAS